MKYYTILISNSIKPYNTKLNLPDFDTLQEAMHHARITFGSPYDIDDPRNVLWFVVDNMGNKYVE